MDEELNKILGNSELNDAAKAQAIKELVGKDFVPLNRLDEEKKKTKEQLDAYNATKQELEQFKESKLTDEQRQAEQFKKLQAQIEQSNIAMSKLSAKNTFASAGFKEEDYNDFVDSISTADTEKTKTLAEEIRDMMLKVKADAEKKVKEDVLNNTPKPAAGNTNPKAKEDDVNELQKKYDEAVKNREYDKMAYYIRLINESNKNNK